MDMTEKTLDSREVYRGKIFTVTRDDIALPNDSRSIREIVHHNGGVCCAAFNDRDELALVRQYRYAFGEVLTELPAGKLEPGELPDEAIRREVREEIGAECSGWRCMGRLYPTPGYCTEIIHLYACRINSIGDTHFDSDENLETLFVPFERAVRMVLAGELTDAKTQTLILRLFAERKMN